MEITDESNDTSASPVGLKRVKESAVGGTTADKY
jgi:hypothetical protein